MPKKNVPSIDQKLFSEYAELKTKAKSIEVRIKELVPLVIGEMERLSVDKVPTDIGSFVITPKKKWKFSAKVEAAEERLEKLKTQEKADGTAEFEESKELKFFGKKEQENAVES